MKLHPNALGTFKTDDGRWAIRPVNESAWALQHRDDPADPWGWEIVGHAPSRVEAVQALTNLIKWSSP